MPSPVPGESLDEYLKRAVPAIMENEKLPADQAAAKSKAIFENFEKAKKDDARKGRPDPTVPTPLTPDKA